MRGTLNERVFAIFSSDPSGLSLFKNNTDHLSSLIEQSHAQSVVQGQEGWTVYENGSSVH